MVARINMNGINIIAGRNISISNGRVRVDGKDVTPAQQQINIEVHGDIERIDADVCDHITVSGAAGQIYSASGDVRCGDVAGHVTTMSGDVECGSVGGNVKTMSGDVTHR